MKRIERPVPSWRRVKQPPIEVRRQMRTALFDFLRTAEEYTRRAILMNGNSKDCFLPWQAMEYKNRAYGALAMAKNARVLRPRQVDYLRAWITSWDTYEAGSRLAYPGFIYPPKEATCAQK